MKEKETVWKAATCVSGFRGLYVGMVEDSWGKGEKTCVRQKSTDNTA